MTAWKKSMMMAARAPFLTGVHSNFAFYVARLAGSAERTLASATSLIVAFARASSSRAATAPTSARVQRPAVVLQVSRPTAPAVKLASPVGVPRSMTRPVTGPMTREQQFAKLAHVVESAVASGREAATCHASAGRQLDLAQYGLSTLMDELADVMVLPQRSAPATLHPIVPVARHTEPDALAA